MPPELSAHEHATATLRASLERMALAPTQLRGVRETLGAHRPSEPGADWADDVPLPNILASLDAPAPTSAEIVPLDVIGEGGMGIVRLARQRSLGRDVALKTAKTADARTVRALVREARMMGGLEHPSIVPVHALGLTDSGAPVIVMKRIDGTSWRALLTDPDHPEWAPRLVGHGDRLRANVEILLQVANALAYAHERGVIHRDLKPDNVMLGHFGEVYLLDWGIALRLDERTREPFGIVGTPGYLAPEMARGEPTDTDVRSDVYLLGATLFELVTGHVPHEADSALGALARALLGERTPLPDHVPDELRTLIDAALATDPSQRPATAEAFRVELVRFLASREADRLARAARTRAESARRLLATEGASSAEAFRELVEARFALRTAREARSNDRAIESDLDGVLRALAERELAVGSLETARHYADEMGAVPDELRDALVRSAAEREQRARVLERATRDLANRDLSRVWRSFALLSAVAVGATLIYIFGVAKSVLTLPPPIDVLRLHVVLGVPATVILVKYWRRVNATTESRRLFVFFAAWGSFAPLFAALDLWRGSATYTLVNPFLAGLPLSVAEMIVTWPEFWPSVVLQFAVLATAIVKPSAAATAMTMFFPLNLAAIVYALAARERRLRALRATAPT